jgi:hypothetical protein
MVKGSKSDKETTYEFRDIVLAKVRGYPPWPGMVRSSLIAFQTRSRTQHTLQSCSGRGPPERLKRGTERTPSKQKVVLLLRAILSQR